ncbi:MAG: lysophospholipid acyltransferase family protein [Nannocystaceae bacterium]
MKSLFKKPAQAAFSVLAWGATFTWMTGIALAGVVASPVVPFRKIHHIIGGPGMGMCLRFTLSKIEIIYHPDYDRERRGVFCQNHVSLMDAFAACASIPHAFGGMMNAWQFNIPIYGRIMKLASGIPVPKKRAGRYQAIAKAAKDRAAMGISILVFPEAHRTLDGKVHKFRRGVFMMAQEAGLPIIPLATHGMYKLMPKGTLMVTPSDLKFFVGPQIETVGMTKKDIPELIKRTQAVISAFSDTGEVPHDLVAELQQLSRPQAPADLAASAE